MRWHQCYAFLCSGASGQWWTGPKLICLVLQHRGVHGRLLWCSLQCPTRGASVTVWLLAKAEANAQCCALQLLSACVGWCSHVLVCGVL